MNIDNNDIEDFDDFRSELRMSSGDYDIESFFNTTKQIYNMEENEEDDKYSHYDAIYEDILECERFFKTKAGQMYVSRLIALRNSKVAEFASAKSDELLKVQAEFNAYESVIYTATSFTAEKEFINDNLDK